MRKSTFFACAAAAAMLFTSCGASKESAYRKAYEKAKAQEQAQQPVINPVQQPVQQPQEVAIQQLVTAQQQPVQQVAPAPVMATADNVAVRRENVTLVAGTGLKAYSVVVGSFGVQANALGLQNTLKGAGYDAQVAKNAAGTMYRVIISSFDDKAAAAQSKESVKSAYPGAWLLMKE